MSLEGQDRHTIIEITNWFAKEAWSKFARGVEEHGGTLIHKGGLFWEAEQETLDHVIYLQTLRRQLELVDRLMGQGRLADARLALRLILHGKTTDRLPE